MVYRNARGLRSLLLSFSLFGVLAGTSSLALAQGTGNSFGSDSNGQLGNGAPNADSNAPVAVSTVTDFVAIAAGKYHTIGVKSDGTVQGWGFNGTGQLGNGSTASSSAPVAASALTGVIAVAAGETHSLALKNDGTVWAWGGNASGQLGDGSTSQRNTAVQVKKDANTVLSNAVQVAAGGSHSLALLSDGTVWAWGKNNRGQLGNGTNNQSNYAVQVAVNANTMVSGIVSVAGGFEHSVAVKSDGTVWAWGANGFKQLGDGTITDRKNAIKVPGVASGWQAAAGDTFSVVLQSGGTAMAWGYNTNGQLGTGSGSTYVGPSSVVGLTGAVDVAAGNRHIVAVGGDGSVWAWGRNDKGQVGDGTNSNRNAVTQITALTNQTSVAAGFEHSVTIQAVKRDVIANGPRLTIQYGAKFTINGLLTIGTATASVPLIQRTLHYTLDTVEQGTGAISTANGRSPLTVAAGSTLDFHVNPTKQPHNLLVLFDGDRLYNSAKSVNLRFNVIPANTKTYGTNASSEIGGTANLRSLLRRLTDNAVLAGKTVSYDIAGTSLGSAVTDVAGKGSLLFHIDEALGVGTQTVNVSFAGDTDHNPSSATLTLTVGKGRTSIASRSTSGKVGATVKLRATITRTADKALLAGKTVNFAVNGVPAGSAVSQADGTVSLDFVIPTLTAGIYPITVSFDGDDLYQPSVKNGATLTVK